MVILMGSCTKFELFFFKKLTRYKEFNNLFWSVAALYTVTVTYRIQASIFDLFILFSCYTKCTHYNSFTKYIKSIFCGVNNIWFTFDV